MYFLYNWGPQKPSFLNIRESLFSPETQRRPEGVDKAPLPDPQNQQILL